MLSDSCLVVCPVLSCLSMTLVYSGQTVGWIKMPLGKEVGLGSGDIVLDGDPAPRKKHSSRPLFGPCLLLPNGGPSQQLLSSRLKRACVWFVGPIFRIKNA